MLTIVSYELRLDVARGYAAMAMPAGMSGLWQINGHSDLSCDDAVRFDLYYVENWSVMSDLIILSRTGRAALRSSGAY